MRVFVGGDKPLPYILSQCGGSGGVYPAHTIATLITYKSNMTYRTY
jgi:hypothetical protein